MQWNDLYVRDGPKILPDGPYDYTIENVEPKDNVSDYVHFRIDEDITIVSRLYHDTEKSMSMILNLLISAGVKPLDANSCFAWELANVVGKSGRCIVGHYTDKNSGRIKNCVKWYLFPDTDEELSLWKMLVITKAGRKCDACGSTENLDAHHIKPKNAYPALKYDVLNGQCLCRNCHAKWHRENGSMKVGGPGL